MKSSTSLSLRFNGHRANLPIVIIAVIALSIVVGMFLTNTPDEMAAYLLVTLGCAAPIAFWIATGAKGIPIMPAIAAMHFIYFGVPILRDNIRQMGFGPSEILGAAATVSLFLIVATVTWSFLLIVGVRRSNLVVRGIISDVGLKRFMFLGLLLGISYYIAVFSGLLSWLGPSFGFVRSIALTSSTVACFVFGSARAKGLLRGRDWVLAIGSVTTLVILSAGSLYLVGAVTLSLAAAFGYVITSKRVPWALFAAAAVTIVILHAGKDSMRTKYWLPNTTASMDITPLQIPGLMKEWVETGLTAIASDDQYDSVIDRASLLSLLMRAQRLAPDYVPFLEGRSYAVLPEMLVPRFVNENKITSQTSMNMLNVHFGFQTVEGTTRTAVGWGLIAEGYGNFGYLGVIGVAIVVGAIAGLFERLSDGAPLMSLPALTAVAAMMNFINMEGDAAGILTSLFQSLAAISIMFWLMRLLSKNRRRL